MNFRNIIQITKYNKGNEFMNDEVCTNKVMIIIWPVKQIVTKIIIPDGIK